MGALEGIRVLDLSRLIPGPYATKLLADLGAQVIKVEQPPAGDYLRNIPPLIEIGGADRPHTTGAIFARLNRGKQSLGLNFEDGRGRQVLLRIAKTADVWVESYRPGMLDRRGLGYDDLTNANPRIIYCSLSGYGREGPYAQRAGHDLNYLALAGILGLNAQAGGAPIPPPVQIADLAGGMNAAMQVLSALVERTRTGRGKYLDAALFDTAVGWMDILIGSIYRAERANLRPGGMLLTGLYPCYHIYETADGSFMSLGALEPRFWQSFCQAVGRVDLVNLQFNAEGVERVAGIFRSRTRAEWVDLAEKVDVCLEPLLTIEEAMRLPQVQARGLAAEDTRPVPRLGENTAGILRETGYREREIEEMGAAGVIELGER